MVQTREPFCKHFVSVGMNKKQLLSLGVPEDCIPTAISIVQIAARNKSVEAPKKLIPKLVTAPAVYAADPIYGPLAAAIIEHTANDIPLSEIEYSSWGKDFDDNSIRQIRNACKLPVSRAAALMPDAHSGYGCLLYTSPSPRDATLSRMPSSA